ncbi:MAG: hypothetical protein ACD_39C00113G0001 [uncultured bacterium]|nr:MAG: hypothetical protein ACD_39C00113G0001 [uncultured bacterium]
MNTIHLVDDCLAKNIVDNLFRAFHAFGNAAFKALLLARFNIAARHSLLNYINRAINGRICRFKVESGTD